MGLDTVELIMRAEEEFGIEISDEDAAQISTPGQLCLYIGSKLKIQSSSSCLSSAAFYPMRRALIEVTGVSRREIGPQSALKPLFPRAKRRAAWQQLKIQSGASLPKLMRPDWLINGIVIGFLGLWVAAFFSVLSGSVMWASSFFFGSIAYLWLIFKITTPLAICFPTSCQTVGGMVKTTMFSMARSSASEPISAREEELWLTVQALIADELGVPLEKVRPDADFIRDLDAD